MLLRQHARMAMRAFSESRRHTRKMMASRGLQPISFGQHHTCQRETRHHKQEQTELRHQQKNKLPRLSCNHHIVTINISTILPDSAPVSLSQALIMIGNGRGNRARLNTISKRYPSWTTIVPLCGVWASMTTVTYWAAQVMMGACCVIVRRQMGHGPRALNWQYRKHEWPLHEVTVDSC